MTLDEVRGISRACLTMAEVAALLGVDARTVSRGCQDGELPMVKVGRRILIPREPLLALLEAR